MTQPSQADRRFDRQKAGHCPQDTVGRIPPERLLEASERLVGRASGEKPGAAARRFLEAAALHGIDLSNMWGWFDHADGGAVRHVCLMAPGSGGTGMLFTSQAAGVERERELSGVIDAACLGASGVRLAQALLEPHERGAETAFRLAGFTRVGDLLYLERPWTQPVGAAPQEWPREVTVSNWRPGEDGALCEALERSYIDTLDCPELCGMRDVRDVLVSHRATGRFDPRLWWLLRVGERAAGALLLNPSPAQGHTELVYLGLAPEARGLGLADKLLTMGLHALAKRPEKRVTCAVDARNAPARRLYERHGFVEFARRVAMVRALRGESVDIGLGNG